MKNLVYIPIFISVLFSFLYTGCENAELQKSALNDTMQIETRGACFACAGANECCGLLTITGGTGSHEFKICGTVDGDAITCESDPTPCSVPVNGLEHTSFILSTGGTTSHVFCIAENSGIVISHLDAGTVNMTLTFQYGQGTPQTINVTFNGIEKKEFEADGDCVVSECD